MRFVYVKQDIFCSENNLWKQNLTTESDLDCNTYRTLEESQVHILMVPQQHSLLQCESACPQKALENE